MKQLPLRFEKQLSNVSSEVEALVAVIRPILQGTLYALKRDIVEEVGGYANVKVKMLPRLYRRGDGDCGVCFEYAVHDALNRAESSVMERVEDALSQYCNVPGAEISSILFGAEKSGAIDLISTAKELLNQDSMLLYGSRGRPAKLIKHIDSIAAAFRRPSFANALPQSISGLWKADLFLGHSDSDRWVGTTVKINANALEGARGLRIGIVPARHGRSDRIEKDDRRNLVICPLPYDGAFVEIFYRGWIIVRQFIGADANMPGEVALPDPADRTVAKLLADRREYAVLDVHDALTPLAQPQLLETTPQTAELVECRHGEGGVGVAIAPVAKPLDG